MDECLLLHKYSHHCLNVVIYTFQYSSISHRDSWQLSCADSVSIEYNKSELDWMRSCACQILLLLLRNTSLCFRHVRFGHKLGQISTNWTNISSFKVRFSVHFGSSMHRNWFFKAIDLFHLVLNLTYFRAKSDIPEPIPQ